MDESGENQCLVSVLHKYGVFLSLGCHEKHCLGQGCSSSLSAEMFPENDDMDCDREIRKQGHNMGPWDSGGPSGELYRIWFTIVCQ